MNKAISRIFIIGAVLFVALIVNLTWIMGVRADWFQDRPENKRSIAKEMRIKRGDILGFDGSKIAGVVRRSGYYYRTYPEGTVAPQLIGYDTVRYGRSGIEEAMNDVLTGQSSDLGVQSWVDRLLGRRPKGANVKLTIVPAVQKAAQQALQQQKGAIVVLDPKTGALIASASAPTYDPSTLEDAWARLSADRSAPLFDRPTQGLYEPGSAFKIVTATAGLESGKVTPTSDFVDTGTYVVFGGKVTNYGGAVFGPNDFTTALTYSINTTFAKVGNLVKRKRLIAAMQAFGFYQVPPLPLPEGEIVAGGRYGKNGRLLAPDAFMNPLDVAWAACGQEQVLSTPLQMALVAAGVANGGRVMKPYYAQEVISPTGEVVQKAKPEQWLVAMKPATASELSTMMQRVVNAGTGVAAALEGIQVAGKTGTAEHGDANLAWFIAFAPADDPTVAIAVMIEDTQSTGGEAAAPLAADVLKAALAQPALP